MFVNEEGKPAYSVVVPFHNEQESVRELYKELSAVMTGRYEPVEFIFIDDHSTDSTNQVLSELATSDSRVVAIRLKRNYGQTVALAAGFDTHVSKPVEPTELVTVVASLARRRFKAKGTGGGRDK